MASNNSRNGNLVVRATALCRNLGAVRRAARAKCCRSLARPLCAARSGLSGSLAGWRSLMVLLSGGSYM